MQAKTPRRRRIAATAGACNWKSSLVANRMDLTLSCQPLAFANKIAKSHFHAPCRRESKSRTAARRSPRRLVTRGSSTSAKKTTKYPSAVCILISGRCSLPPDCPAGPHQPAGVRAAVICPARARSTAQEELSPSHHLPASHIPSAVNNEPRTTGPATLIHPMASPYSGT